MMIRMCGRQQLFVEDRGFLEDLKDLIFDNNPMVIANAVAALAEIQDSSARPIFEITSHTLSKLLTALNECTEWGQVFVLDSLSRYEAADAREAENTVERVTPCLQHANCAVVLSAVKIILLQMKLITSTDVVRNLCKKMAPPLVTLLSAEPAHSLPEVVIHTKNHFHFSISWVKFTTSKPMKCLLDDDNRMHLQQKF